MNNNEKTEYLNICCLCNIPENNHSLLELYSKLSKRDFTQKNNKYIFKQKINNQNYNINFNTYSTTSKDHIGNFSESAGVIILFDTNSQTEFENILDKWLVFLRDYCFYKGNIIIIGEDRQEECMRIGVNSSFRNVKDEEVYDSIAYSEIKATVEYKRLSITPLDQIINSFVIKSSITYKKILEEKDNDADSDNTLKRFCVCLIY